MDVKALIHKHKPLLDIFVGTHAHDKSDGVWADLVTFPTPLTRLPPMDLQASVTTFCDQLGALARLYSLSTAERAHTISSLKPSSMQQSCWKPMRMQRCSAWRGAISAQCS